MVRVYSNYSNEEMEILKAESEKLGLSLSAFQKYRTLLSLRHKKGDETDITKLIEVMKQSLSNKRSEDVFIVSSLLPDEWVKLNKREKNTLVQTLKRIVYENPDLYYLNAVLPGKINQYVVR